MNHHPRQPQLFIQSEPATLYRCPSVFSWQAKVSSHTQPGHSYLVNFQRSERHPHLTYWSCECTGYSYRGYCSHIERAKRHYCGWDQLFDPCRPIPFPGAASYPPPLMCPVCEREIVESIRYIKLVITTIPITQYTKSQQPQPYFLEETAAA